MATLTHVRRWTNVNTILWKRVIQYLAENVLSSNRPMPATIAQKQYAKPSQLFPWRFVLSSSYGIKDATIIGPVRHLHMGNMAGAEVCNYVGSDQLRMAEL